MSLSFDTRHSPHPRQRHGFTLLELLVVIGVIAALSFGLFGGLAGGSKSAALQAAQATISSLVTAARTKAPAANRKVRLLVNADPGEPERYLRFVVLQSARQAGSSPVDWDTVLSVHLPPGVYILPGSLAGLVTDATGWKRASDPAEDLVSDLFKNPGLSYTLEGDAAAQLWTGVAFTPNGTLAAVGSGPPPRGSIVIALGQVKAAGSYAPGSPPVELGNARTVRGLVLSAYGVPALLNEWNAF